MRLHGLALIVSLCALAVTGLLPVGRAASTEDREAVIASVSDSVVSVDSHSPDGRRLTASGVIWNREGNVVTVAAIVGSGERFDVITRSGDKFTAQLVGVDAASSIAVLMARGLEGAVVKPADSAHPKIGEHVVAVGHPSGHGVSNGVVSSLARVAGSKGGLWMIQTTASVRPGDVGGLLVNARGEMIGLLAGRVRGSLVRAPLVSPRASVSRVGVSAAEPEPVNFALPMDVVNCVAREILERGRVRRAWFGLAAASPEVLRTSEFLTPTTGSLVVGLVQGSPAHRDGVAIGDVVVGIGGRDVRSPADLERSLVAVAPEDRVAVTVVRMGNRIGLKVTAAERDPGREEIWVCRHGLRVKEQGLVVVEGWSGIDAGDRAIYVDGNRVNDLATLQIALMRNPRSITVLRGRELVSLPGQ